MPRSRPRRSRIRLLATERGELQRRVAPRTSTQQDAYRAEIILRVATGQTDAAIAQDMRLPVRTLFVWRHRFVEPRLDGLKDRPARPRDRASPLLALPRTRAVQHTGHNRRARHRGRPPLKVGFCSSLRDAHLRPASYGHRPSSRSPPRPPRPRFALVPPRYLTEP